jgi:chaperonin GroEL
VSKSIISGQDALHKLLAGTNLIANAVKATLGPSGRNCVYERVGTNQSVSTRDGVSVANQIEAIDPHEQMAVDMIRSVAREAVDQSGDGTTTATLLAQAIYAEGVKAITVGANPVALKRESRRLRHLLWMRSKGWQVPSVETWSDKSP